MNLPSIENILADMQQFVTNPVLLTSTAEIRADMNIPRDWVEMLRQQKEGVKSWVSPWAAYQNLLPGVYNFLQNKVRGVCVLLEAQKSPSLIYVYSQDGENYLHRGYPPLGDRVPKGQQGFWGNLPPDLQKFYSQLHDGWIELYSGAIGPLPVEDLGLLSDGDWDIEPGDLKKLPFRLHEVITVFNNGGGDYIGLDFGQRPKPVEDCALVWWHENPRHPDIDQNFWALMDGWISGQMEGVDLAG